MNAVAPGAISPIPPIFIVCPNLATSVQSWGLPSNFGQLYQLNNWINGKDAKTMPLSGGASNKAGIRYELLWTVRCMARVMSGDAESIWLEPPGEEGDGVEFSLTSPTGNEYHQVKRQRSGKGRWSLRNLSSEGVLTHFRQKLDDPSSQCVFVSTHAAHPLDDLASRAREAGSWVEFQRAFISSNEWSGYFEDLRSCWDATSKEDAYQRLCRVIVRTVDENSLDALVHSLLGLMVDGEPANATDVLSRFALGKTHRKLTASDIWAHLRERSFEKQTWREQTEVADAIAELNRTYLAGIQPQGIRGESVVRAETAVILDHLDSEDTRNTSLVTGRAGVGKTSVVSQVLSAVEGRGWPVLALRVDRLEPVRRPEEVGQQLGLPASPVRVLAAMSDGQDCLLVIDQLDAISMASGRNPDFYDCIGAMLDEARNYPKMRVLAACRKFDVDNDQRFRQLIREGGMAKEFLIGPFGHETVRRLIENLGLSANHLSLKQIELLSLPIHMRLFSDVAEEGNTESVGFQSDKDLYDAFWRHKQQMIRNRPADAGDIQTVVDIMVDHMNEREVLFVPESLLDAYADVVAVMASENMLTRDGGRISFFHESFFDYLFARGMESTDVNLATYIRGREQSLFMRSQLRQVLLHRREVAPQVALRDVDSILNGEDIRIHLKAIVLSFLGSVENPTGEEWNLIEPLLETELSGHAWSVVHASAPWFDLLDSIRAVEHWLSSDDQKLVNPALWLLRSVQESRADRVAELLVPYLGSSEPWNQRLASLVFLSDLAAGRGFFDLALDTVRTGAMDDFLSQADANREPWHVILTLVGKTPDWACEMIAAYCDRLLMLARCAGNKDPFTWNVGPNGTGGRAIVEAAEAAPQTFVELLLPFVVSALEENIDQSLDQPWPDPIWSISTYADGHGLDDNFLMAMESAMRWLSANAPDTFRHHVESLRSSNFRTIHFLVVRGYEANGEEFADEAIEYVIDALTRFGNHYPAGLRWALARLLASATPCCSDENLERLERLLLNYYTAYEKTPAGRQRWGSAQFDLLRGVEISRLSAEASTRLRELRRKFGDTPVAQPFTMSMAKVESPIPEVGARRMSDVDWLKALGKYDSDRNAIPRHFLKGGALELSSVLESLTKEDPSRFASLVHRLPDDANPAYFEVILRGITGSNLDVDGVVKACLRCHLLPGRPLGRWITSPLVQLQEETLPGEVLEMVAWYATKDPDPGQNTPDLQRDALNEGINTARGAAAESMAGLIFRDFRHLAFFEPHLKVMANDPSVAVRSLVAHTLLAVLVHDRDLAVQCFLDLCNADDELLGTHYVEMFLKYGVQTHFQLLEPVLSRMVASNIDEVATAGSRQICLASLTIEEALPIARRCVSGSKSLRVGAAAVYSVSVKHASHRAHCEEMLGDLLSDPDPDVRNAAARCFYQFEGQELRDCQALIEKYTLNTAFGSGFAPLIRALEYTTAHIPEATLMVCERFFALAGQDAGDIRTSAAADSHAIADLVVRVYSQAKNRDFRSRCLDLIDSMSLLGAFGLDRVTAEFDR